MNVKEYNIVTVRGATSGTASRKPLKYRNKKTEYNGILFDSKKEADYCLLLDIRKNASKLSEKVKSYERQIPYDLVVNNQKICKYILDFIVIYCDGRKEYIDVKGMHTPMYNLKKRLMKAIYNIDILEK